MGGGEGETWFSNFLIDFIIPTIQGLVIDSRRTYSYRRRLSILLTRNDRLQVWHNGRLFLLPVNTNITSERTLPAVLSELRILLQVKVLMSMHVKQLLLVQDWIELLRLSQTWDSLDVSQRRRSELLPNASLLLSRWSQNIQQRCLTEVLIKIRTNHLLLVLVLKITDKEAIVKLLSDRTTASWIVGSIVCAISDIIVFIVEVIDQLFHIIDTSLHVLIVQIFTKVISSRIGVIIDWIRSQQIINRRVLILGLRIKLIVTVYFGICKHRVQVYWQT